MMDFRLLRIFLFSIVLLFSACADDVQTEFSRYRAYFIYNKVSTALPLYNAVNSPGEYCSVYLQGSKIFFTSPNNSFSEPRSAISAYYSNYIAICGWIIGKSNVPDMTSGNLLWLCFDRACSNCYANNSKSIPLSLQERGFAFCSSCHRKYDLNNLGIIVEGEKGIKLERYRMNYTIGNNTIIVNNLPR